MTAPLMPHQVSGAEWLASRSRGYLGDTPGSGKTRTLVTAAIESGAIAPLVFCPAIVRSMWRREFDAPVPGHFLTPVYSYDEITRGGDALLVKLLTDHRPDLLILDEAHYLKHSTAKRTVQILGRDGYARRIPRVWAASGTPIPKHPGELWTIGSSLFPALMLEHGLKTRDDWMERFTVRRYVPGNGAMREKVVGNRNVTELQDILSRMLLRRDPVGDKIWWQVITLDGAYDDAPSPGRSEMLHALNAEAIDLERIANDPSVSRVRRLIGEAKAPAVVEMLRSQLADSDEKMVVMFHHRSVGKILKAGLLPFGCAYVDGDTSPASRDWQLDVYQHSSRDVRVFLAQQQACGTGLDGLQHVASRIVLVEPSWSAYENLQAAKRLDRLGQVKGGVRCQMIALAGTLDEAIVRQNARETKDVADALGKGATT